MFHLPQFSRKLTAAVPASMRFRVSYQLITLNATTQSLLKNTILPTTLKIVDKYLQLKVPETSNLLVSSMWSNPLNKCLFATVDTDVITGEQNALLPRPLAGHSTPPGTLQRTAAAFPSKENA